MAKWIEWSEEDRKVWYEWISGRPQVIQDMAQKHNLIADELYELTTTGQRVIIASMNENGTVMVDIHKEFNPGRSDVGRRVFGIDPADLKPCDLPPGVEMVKSEKE